MAPPEQNGAGAGHVTAVHLEDSLAAVHGNVLRRYRTEQIVRGRFCQAHDFAGIVQSRLDLRPRLARGIVREMTPGSPDSIVSLT